MSASWGGFNYGRGKSSLGAKKEKDTRQGNLNHPRRRGIHRGRGYGGGRGRPYWCFSCGVEGHRAFECSNYSMQESKKGQQPSLNLVQADNEEEGLESEFSSDMGGNLMIRRSMMISEKEQRHSSINEYSWL